MKPFSNTIPIEFQWDSSILESSFGIFAVPFQNLTTMQHFKKSLLVLLFVSMTISCKAQTEEVFVTANTNLCPNCFNQYRMLDSIPDNIRLHLVFQQSSVKEARKFTDKFFHITRNYDLICNDSLFQAYSHNIFPWLHYYQRGVLVFDADLNHYEKWIPIINRLSNKYYLAHRIAQLPEEVTLSKESRCITLKNNYLFMDFTYHELHLFDENFRLLKSQDFSESDYPALYQRFFGDEKTWQNVSRYASEIAPYIPDFGKIKTNNGSVYNDTLFLLINVNYLETYFNEKRQDTTVKVLNESAIIGLDEQLNIQTIYPLRFRDSLQFDAFTVNAYAHCVFQIKDWDDIVLSVSQKEENEKHILCRMQKEKEEIQFKSLVDNAFIPDFNEKHHLGTSLCLVKAEGQNAYFNVAPIITNYESGRILELPFSNENAHFDLKHGIAEADYILGDALQTSDGDFLLFHFLQKRNKLSLIDNAGSLIWTLHLPDQFKKVYLVDERTVLYVDDDNYLISIF